MSSGSNKQASPSAGKIKGVPGAVGQPGGTRNADSDFVKSLAKAHRIALVGMVEGDYLPPKPPVAVGEPKDKKPKKRKAVVDADVKPKAEDNGEPKAKGPKKPKPKAEDDDDSPTCPCPCTIV